MLQLIRLKKYKNGYKKVAVYVMCTYQMSMADWKNYMHVSNVQDIYTSIR